MLPKGKRSYRYQEQVAKGARCCERWYSIQHRALSLGLPHPKNSLQDMVPPPKQGAGVA